MRGGEGSRGSGRGGEGGRGSGRGVSKGEGEKYMPGTESQSVYSVIHVLVW